MAGFLRKVFGGAKDAAIEPTVGDLGPDILDLSGFDENWENIVLLLHADRATAQKACEYIRTGTFSGAQVQGANSWVDIRPLRSRQPEYPRLVAALLVALSSANERANASALYLNVKNQSPDIGAVLRVVGSAKPGHQLTISDIETLGKALGWSPTELLDKVVSEDNYYRGANAAQLQAIDGIELFLQENIDQIRAALTPAKHGQQPIWSRLVGISETTLELLRAEVCDGATANSKSLRKAVQRFYLRLQTAAQIDGLRQAADGAKPAQRARTIERAVELEAGAERDAFLDFLRETYSADRSVAVKDALTSLDAPAEQEPDTPVAELAPVHIAKVHISKFGAHLKDAQRDALDTVNGNYARPWSAPLLLADLLRNQADVLQDLTPHHVARMLRGAGSSYTGGCLPLLRDSALRPTPLNISEALRHDDRPEREIVKLCAAVMGADPFFWTSEEVEAWIPHHVDDLVALLHDRDNNYDFSRPGYLALLQTAKSIPPKLRKSIVEAAVNGYKSDRDVLQKSVDPQDLDLVLPYLTSRKKTERVGAAGLLKVLALPESVAPLLAAARKEKDDAAKVALLSALDALGTDIDEFVSADALLVQATKAMSKKSSVPKSVAWLDSGTLPTVSWADGSPVDPVIMHWLIVSAVRAKTAEPSPLAVRYFAGMNQQELRAFGSTLLDLWLREDTRTPTAEEAQAEADALAVRYFQWASNSPQSRYHGLTVEAIAAGLVGGIQNTIKGSATTSKGLLGVVAASAGPEVADRCSRYIRKHRGQRASQAKILLQMLAWIDEPATVQLVMSIAARFRPKGIQAEAARQAELLAERRGWTVDDLSDRSIPDAGFEANGRRVFDYGERTFTAHLGDDLTVTLHNDETGKTVRSLPKGRADEDADAIKEMKKDLTAAKKELKSVVALQPTRLHLAMCAQRSWSVDDFTRYFVTHPVMARLASRLVWMSTAGDSEPVGFRPLTDGTLLLADDDEFIPPADARITIAHGHLLEGGQSWKQHMGDYEVAPLFEQFDRPIVETSSSARSIDTFEGYMFNDGTFRGQVNRHAWQLGQPQDAGWVGEIVKDVPTVDLKAVVSLHGGLSVAAYGVGDTTLAFGKLFFVPSSGSGWDAERWAVELGGVPPVLLTEIYAELQAFASAGDGYDPNYTKKVGF